MDATGDEKLHEIRSLAEAGRKIDAIKLIRQHYSISLSEATEFLTWVLKNDPSAPRPGADKIPADFQAYREQPKRAGGRDRGMSLALVIFIGVGVILLAVSGYLVHRQQQFRESGKRVEAVVVENIYRRNSFTPVYEFVWDGEMKRVTSNVSAQVMGKPANAVGTKIFLWVAADDYTSFSEDTWFGSWFPATLVGGLGVVFLLITVPVCLIVGRG